MLYISAATFGGFVIVTLMKKKFVDEYKWIDDDEMLDLTAIAQSSPGAIAVNAAILFGYKIGGLLGTAEFGRPLSIWQSGLKAQQKRRSCPRNCPLLIQKYAGCI